MEAFVLGVLSVLFVISTAPAARAAPCDSEESPLCETCEDGVDNDSNDHIDAEDPACSTLWEYQRAAVVVTKPDTKPLDEASSVDGVLLPGGLTGDPVDGRCGDSATCSCPAESPQCQAAGRPCAVDGDCAAVPYPLGRSRAGICSAAANDPSIRCGSESDLIRMAHSIQRIPGQELDPILVMKAASPAMLSFAGGRHVVDVETIEIEPEAELVLSGEADTVLVVRVRGPLVLGAGSAVSVDGALAADRVLWVFAGGEGRIALGEGSRFVGTILAPERAAVEVGREARIQGAILASDVRSAGLEPFVDRIDD